MKNYNIYIDESCHLENDAAAVMAIAYAKIDSAIYTEVKQEIKSIKLSHKSPTELKWSKLSYSRLSLYKALIDYFFYAPIDFRAVLVKNKKNLDHELFNRGDHNAFYYKVVYQLLHNPYVNNKDSEYSVYLDIKDTRGKERLRELDKFLKFKYAGDSPFKYFQHIQSHENELIQLTDFFIGAITYKARNLNTMPNASPVKCEIIEYLEKKSGYSLDEGTEPWVTKFNIFDFQIRTK